MPKEPGIRIQGEAIVKYFGKSRQNASPVGINQAKERCWGMRIDALTERRNSPFR